MYYLEARVERVLKAAGVAITGMRFGDQANKTTWRVQPLSLQPAAQPIIDAFDPADPAHEQADVTADATLAVDTERLTSAIIWAILDTYSAPATPAKYQAARTKILNAYRARPWVA